MKFYRWQSHCVGDFQQRTRTSWSALQVPGQWSLWMSGNGRRLSVGGGVQTQLVNLTCTKSYWLKESRCVLLPQLKLACQRTPGLRFSYHRILCVNVWNTECISSLKRHEKQIGITTCFSIQNGHSVHQLLQANVKTLSHARPPAATERKSNFPSFLKPQLSSLTFKASAFNKQMSSFLSAPEPVCSLYGTWWVVCLIHSGFWKHFSWKVETLKKLKSTH